MGSIYKTIHDIGIIPVIDLNNVEDAAPLAKALCNGGLPIAEVICRTKAAQDSMIEMKKACPEMLIGAGTVFTRKQVDSALDAGAGFIIAPARNPDIIEYCQSKSIPVIAGVANAGDIEAAMSLGLDTVQYFPAEDLGGIKMIKALSALFGEIRFIAAGGITESNVNEYLNEPCILACVGTWMTDKKAIAEKDFGKIEELTRNAVNTMLGFTIKHIGINEENEDGAELANKFAGLFGGRVRETSKGWFGSEYAEIMSRKAKTGRHGHIGIGVNNPDRARRYYEALGYTFDESTAAYDEDGKLTFIYLCDEIGGFALHIVKK